MRSDIRQCHCPQLAARHWQPQQGHTVACFHHIQKSILYRFNMTTTVTPQKTFFRKGKTKWYDINVLSHKREFTFTSSLSFGKNFRVGKLWILTSSSSFAVESILAMTMSLLSLYFSPSSSHIGANCLQCPHQGASVANWKNRAFALRTKLDLWDFKKSVDKEQPDKEPACCQYEIQITMTITITLT